MIEKLYKTKGFIRKVKAITKGTCNRCLSTNITTDGFGIQHCLDCYHYQEITSEMYLYRYEQNRVQKKHILSIDYHLTDKQLIGSNFLLRCLNRHKSGFLQAVCGAGKTEMSFQAILQALNNNQVICFVTPRVEVLKEVKKRFEKHFPKTCIKILYADNKDYEQADLLFSTPQQLIHFYNEFDLIIIDEVDAYPYANNDSLARLVTKALKESGLILTMSATIHKKYDQLIKKGKLEYLSIASRYHKLDIPIPKLKRVNKNQTFEKTINLIKSKIKNKRRVIVFVPTIKIGEFLSNKFLEEDIKSEFISSKTNYKNHIIKRFRNDDFKILIATTVLERGVTFRDIDCIVVNAEHAVFSKASLIQISGRVGRMKEYQNGEVIFLYDFLSIAMKKCIKEIKWMNRMNQDEM